MKAAKYNIKSSLLAYNYFTCIYQKQLTLCVLVLQYTVQPSILNKYIAKLQLSKKYKKNVDLSFPFFD